VLVELELWPNLIDMAHAAGIPLVVINGRLSDRSFRRYQRMALFTQPMFRKLSHVVSQSETYADRFRRCGCPPASVTVSGSLKFDNVQFESSAPQITQLRELVGLQADDRVLVLGSTQSPEEMAGCKAFLAVRDRWPDLKCIVVPRHPDRFDEVFEELSRLPARLVRRSRLTAPMQEGDWNIVLVDTVGELRWWWGLAEIAVVGGSFGERGGQNMLEPAAYGANVAFGPNTSNFRDIAELLIDNDAATRLPDLASLKDWLQLQLEYPGEGRGRGERARELIASQQGATQRTLEVILANAPA
jgi:3-deoxy-D-manno-octulosonic-acid transferase